MTTVEKFSRTNIVIFLWILLPLLYIASIGGQARYYIESALGKESAFFSDISITAYNQKGDYDVFDAEVIKFSSKYIVIIPSKYRKYDFYFSGRIWNSARDVSMTVNNVPVETDVSLPESTCFFWENLYLERHFSSEITSLKSSNVIVVKSGKKSATVSVKFED